LVRMREPKEGTPERYNRAARVLSGWTEDPQFQNADGSAKVLNVDGNDGFMELVRQYSGNQPYRAILDELVRVGSVERIDGDQVRLLKAYYEPVTGRQEEEKLNILGIASGDLLETIAYNIRRTDAPPFYQQEIYERFPEEKLGELRELIRKHCDQFAIRTDRILYSNLSQQRPERKDSDRRAGVGIYYFESNWEDTPDSHLSTDGEESLATFDLINPNQPDE